MSVSPAAFLRDPHVQRMPVSDVTAAVRTAKAAKDLRSFIKQAWPIIEPGQPYLHNWHIDLIAEYLMAVDAGEIQRLALNVPPRHMKSVLVTVMWPVWSWLQRPETSWLFWSYSVGLMSEHSQKRRDIIESDWYQERWGDVVRLAHDQNEKTKYMNTRRGVMDSTPKKTGKGGNRLCIDDPSDPEQTYSDVQREAVLRFYDQSLTSRLNNPETDPTVIVMQRLHDDDLTGHVAERGFTVVKVPSIAEAREVVQFPVSGRNVVREEGDLLWPERFPRKVLDQAQLDLGVFGFSSQHQQNPSPPTGGLFKDEWWQFFDPSLIGAIDKAAQRVIQIWDTAHKTGQENDWSVCATWADVGEGVPNIQPGYYLLDLFRKRLNFPELEDEAEYRRGMWRPSNIVVEDKASGISLIQAMHAKKIPAEAFDAGKDKVFRANASTGYVAAGFCHLPIAARDQAQVMAARRKEEIEALPEDLHNVAWFLYEHRNFPKAKHDDIVDTTTCLIMYCELNPPTTQEGYVLTGTAKGGWGGTG